MFPAFLAALFFAMSASLAHRSSQLVGALAANFARLCVACLLLGGWALGFGGGFHGVALRIFVLSGAVGFGIGDLALFAALPRLGSRLTALMVQCLASPFAAVIEWLWLGTRPRPIQLGCGALILLGVAIAVAPDRSTAARLLAEEDDPQLARRHHIGLLIGTVAALGQAGGAVISRKGYAVVQAAGQTLDGGTAAWQRSVGGLVIVALGYFLLRRRLPGLSVAFPRWRAAWPWIIGNALVGAAIGVSCYQWALATTPSAIVLPIVALTPLLVIPFAYFIEHERPSLRSLAGGALAVVAAAVLARVG